MPAACASASRMMTPGMHGTRPGSALEERLVDRHVLDRATIDCPEMHSSTRSTSRNG